MIKNSETQPQAERYFVPINVAIANQRHRSSRESVSLICDEIDKKDDLTERRSETGACRQSTNDTCCRPKEDPKVSTARRNNAFNLQDGRSTFADNFSDLQLDTHNYSYPMSQNVQMQTKRAPSPHSSLKSATLPSLNQSSVGSPRIRCSSCSPLRNQSTSRSTQNSKTKRSLNSSSTEALCRICHGSASSEQLFSPCYCSGSIGLLHISCLQRWLGSSNKTCCELCNFQFTVERNPKPFYMFLKKPGNRRDKRHLVCDIGSFVFLAPSSITTAYMCIVASRSYDSGRVEAVLLYCLTLALMILFSAWLTMCLRHNFRLYKNWKRFNQNVKIVCEPSSQDVARSISTTPSGKASIEKVKICSIKIKVTTDGQTKHVHTTPEIHQHVRLTEENIGQSIGNLNGPCTVEKTRNLPNVCERPDIFPSSSQSYLSSSSSSKDERSNQYRSRHRQTGVYQIPLAEPIYEQVTGEGQRVYPCNTYI